jgi:hypothetical protein
MRSEDEAAGEVSTRPEHVELEPNKEQDTRRCGDENNEDEEGDSGDRQWRRGISRAMKQTLMPGPASFSAC